MAGILSLSRTGRSGRRAGCEVCKNLRLKRVIRKLASAPRHEPQGGHNVQDKPSAYHQDRCKQPRSGMGTHALPVPKWSILCKHMQHIRSLNSCRETYSCTPHQTSTEITISFIGLRVHEKKKGAGYFWSPSLKKRSDLTKNCEPTPTLTRS